MLFYMCLLGTAGQFGPAADFSKFVFCHRDQDSIAALGGCCILCNEKKLFKTVPRFKTKTALHCIKTSLVLTNNHQPKQNQTRTITLKFNKCHKGELIGAGGLMA